ncbi:hypothetical protein ACFLQ2_01205 [archaeon]
MGCYAIPLVGAILCYGWRKAFRKTHPQYLWLNLLLFGGSIFGVVDHAWNNELLAFGTSDLLLGVVITLATIGFWGAMLYLPNPSPSLAKGF